MIKQILPYKTIGIIGGGQLGRMICLAAKAMGYRVAVLDPSPNCPCGQAADHEITAPYDDMEAIQQLSRLSDIITYEFENIDHRALQYLEEHNYLPQGSRVLDITQHRFKEKSAIRDLGIPTTPFVLIDGPAALEDALKERTLIPGVLKTTTLGYDGKGQVVIRSKDDYQQARELAEKSECILEQWVPFDKEISVIIARGLEGEMSCFPLAENLHRNNILHRTIAPARVNAAQGTSALDYARRIAEALGLIGVMGVEMFVQGDQVLINELAPRPHNSGHYTIDACLTSQFEQHVRAICGLPLGDPALHSPAVMINILGEHLDKDDLSNLDAFLPLLDRGKLHLYGKDQARPGRKMGHLTLLGDIEESLCIIEESPIWGGA